MMGMGEIWGGMGSTIATAMFLYAMFQQYCPALPYQFQMIYSRWFANLFNPCTSISFYEYTGERYQRNQVYVDIETYLTSNSSQLARRLKADVVDDGKDLVLSMDDYEEITDIYQGVELCWASCQTVSTNQTISLYATDASERRYYMLSFHNRHRKLVTEEYLKHVREQGKKMKIENRQRKLYTNNAAENWSGHQSKIMWSHVTFEHPSTFQTLAMDPVKKKEIIHDLITFRKGKDYYAKVGKAWKRGYLLYGPPGTGKSSMVAAMANLLDYDVYDLELTSVKNNNELKKLFTEISNKSIIVIEDIDCSLDLTGQRKEEKEEDANEMAKNEENSGDDSKVTLSGLLNFIDGLWSCCGEERLIVFTTNHVKKLDPALIRRGRMDKHIELSYCCFEGFKVLAKNYLDLDSHPLFETIQSLIQKTQMTPADVAENLMPKIVPWDIETCLSNLIEALNKVKEEERMKAEKESKPMTKEANTVLKKIKKKLALIRYYVNAKYGNNP
ncbi:hypothetical protein Sjap_015896 [Stephania japonica]|uniref:AAA+ ATPase domain-containing protein n=1 Tax=Stephania japonica TaxID=461633 RepID=A0AAP0NSZ1_9MAGN